MAIDKVNQNDRPQESSLTEILIEEVTGVGKRSVEILNMSQEISKKLIGEIPPTPIVTKRDKESHPSGFIKETINLLREYNGNLFEAMHNLIAVLKQL
jgi:hypothetical protein